MLNKAECSKYLRDEKDLCIGLFIISLSAFIQTPEHYVFYQFIYTFLKNLN